MRHVFKMKVGSIFAVVVFVIASIGSPVDAALIPVRDYPFCVKLDGFWDQLIGNQRPGDYLKSIEARTVVNARNRIKSHRQTQILEFSNSLTQLSNVDIDTESTLGSAIARMKEGKDARGTAAIDAYRDFIYKITKERDSKSKKNVQTYISELSSGLDGVRKSFFFDRMKTTSTEIAKIHVDAYAYCKVQDAQWWKDAGFSDPIAPSQSFKPNDSDEQVRSALASAESRFRIRLGEVKQAMLRPYHSSELQYVKTTGYYRHIDGVAASPPKAVEPPESEMVTFEKAVEDVVTRSKKQYSEAAKNLDESYKKQLASAALILTLETVDSVTVTDSAGGEVVYTIDPQTNRVKAGDEVKN